MSESFNQYYDELLSKCCAHKKDLNQCLFDAVKANDNQCAAALIRRGAIVDPSYNYAINLLPGTHLHIPLNKTTKGVSAS